jgi:hypothetical protein
MIRNSTNRFPNFWVTERDACAKLNIEPASSFQSRLATGMRPYANVEFKRRREAQLNHPKAGVD